ncbi:MAG: hypothetical protein ACLS3C_05895 [Oscillospiraceae bacterium]
MLHEDNAPCCWPAPGNHAVPYGETGAVRQAFRAYYEQANGVARCDRAWPCADAQSRFTGCCEGIRRNMQHLKEL